MTRIIALICSLSGPCDRDTARDVVSLGEVASAQSCLWQAQFRAGSVAALANHGDDERIVFKCESAKVN